MAKEDWIKAHNKRYAKNLSLLKSNIGELSVDEIVEQKNLLLEMQKWLNRVGELKGLLGV